MNELQIFDTENLIPLKDVGKRLHGYFGVVYILEYGKALKIGRTSNPYKRMMQLKRNATKYNGTKLGRVAITPPHTNYIENEKLLHKYFESKRIDNTELFNISLDYLLQEFENVGLIYKDESEELARIDDMRLFTVFSAIPGGSHFLDLDIFDDARKRVMSNSNASEVHT